MDVLSLAAELTDDPLGRNYAAMSDAQVSMDLNELRYVAATRVTYVSLAADLDLGIVRRLIETVDSVAAGDVLVKEMQNWLRSDTGVDIGSDKTRAMLDAFAANTNLPLTAEDSAAIKSLAEGKTSRAAELGLGIVKPGHVEQARA